MAAESTLPELGPLWDYDDPAATEERFNALRDRAEASGDTSYYLQLLTQIARAQGLQRRFDDANRTLDAVADAKPTPVSVEGIRYELERGRVHRFSGDVDEARACFVRAWKYASAAHADFHTVDAAHMLAIVEPKEKQLRWNLRALETAEASDDPNARNWKGSLYHNIGWNYHDSDHYKDALEYFKKALACREEQGKTRPIRIARWTIGRCLRSLGRVDEALVIQEGLRAENEAENESDGYVSEEIGECLLLLDRADESRPHFARAYEILSDDPWLSEHESERLRRLNELARGTS